MKISGKSSVGFNSSWLTVTVI